MHGRHLYLFKMLYKENFRCQKQNCPTVDESHFLLLYLVTFKISLTPPPLQSTFSFGHLTWDLSISQSTAYEYRFGISQSTPHTTIIIFTLSISQKHLLYQTKAYKSMNKISKLLVSSITHKFACDIKLT